MRSLPFLLVLGILTCLPTTALAGGTSEVSMNFQDVDVRTVFETLARFAEKNIVISPEVKGKVTVSFRDTPWDKALESVAQACGCDVHQEVAGIYTITPKSERKKESAEKRVAALKKRQADLEKSIQDLKNATAGDPSANARAALDRLEASKAAAAKLTAALDADVAAKQLAVETARLESLVTASRGHVAELKAKQDAARLAEMYAEKNNVQAAQVLQIHSVADLLKKKVDVLTLATNAVGEDSAKINQQKQVLIVRATGRAQQRLGERLHAVRQLLASGKNATHAAVTRLVRQGRDKKLSDKAFLLSSGYVWVPGKGGAGGKAGEPGKPGTKGRWVKSDLVKGDLVTTARGAFKLKRLPAKKGAASTPPVLKGRVVTATGESVGSDFVVVSPPVKYEWKQEFSTKINKLRQQAERLQKAAALLREAGDKKGAASALDRMNKTRAQIAKLQAEMDKRRTFVTSWPTAPQGGPRVERSINTLRKEVNGLRSDVQELTQLVRQLLDQRRRPARK